MTWFSKRLFSTITNSCLTAIGATALLLAAENDNKLFFYRRRFAFKDIAQRGVACGVGLFLSATGLVRQASMEHMLIMRSSDQNHSRSTSSSGIVPFAVAVVVGSMLGMYFASGQENEEDGDDRSIAVSNDNDGDGDDNENTDGGNGGLFSTSSALRPTEDNSVGAEPLEDGGSVSQYNDGIVIQNDIMATIQDVLGSNNRGNNLDNNIVFSEEQKENDVNESGDDEDDDDDDDEDDDHSIEQQFSDLAMNSDKSFSPQ